MEKESIVHDNVYELVGPRPFKADPQYEQFIRRHKEKKTDSEQETVEPTDSSPPDGSLSDGLAFQRYK